MMETHNSRKSIPIRCVTFPKWSKSLTIMSKNLAPLGPFCYFILLLHILRNRSLLQSMKKYEYHTFYGDKYVLIQTTQLHNALIWLAALAIQHLIHTPLHFVNFCPIVVSRWTSFSTTTNVLNELLKSRKIKASSFTVFSDLKRRVSLHRWHERSAWYSSRNAWNAITQRTRWRQPANPWWSGFSATNN